MKAPLIRYRCTKPEHQHTAKRPSDTMTIHERSWAYCPYDVRAQEHLWSIADPNAPELLVRGPVDPPALG
ncbi:MAG TPA: hypothetical protein VI056_14495 [Candidatus Limnocylindria bacterium]